MGARIWPAMLVTPLLVLADQGIGYALVTPSCAHQLGPWLNAVPLVFIAVAAVLTWRAFAEARRLVHAHQASGQATPGDSDRHGPQRLLLANVAWGIGLLSVVALVALWIPQWGLSPCHA
jgi:hypothetical protein